MWIFDLTQQLNAQNRVNYFTFNPCILQLSTTEYLISYRLCSYDLCQTIQNSWICWNSQYKIFKQPKEAALVKYRDGNGASISHLLQNKAHIQRFAEFDSTGLCNVIFREGTFSIAWNIEELFPNEMNQDARLYRHKDDFRIIYNVFDSEGVKLKYRTFRLTQTHIHLSDERLLFDHIYRNVEKHACFEFANSTIIPYSVHCNSFTRILVSANGTQVMQQIPFTCTRFEKLGTRYGFENILFSLSTPSVAYRKNHVLACGHAKFLYQKIQHFDFLDGIDVRQIRTHGKYIYFMFLYEYNPESGVIARISPMFLPSSLSKCHLPYLLCMSIGMSLFANDKFMISYGNGDCAVRLLLLNRTEVENLLTSTEEACCFLTPKLNIHHVGYFGHLNCGDCAFKEVFQWMYADTPHEISYSESWTSPQPKTSLYVLGGGDVINRYFLPDNTTPPNSIAVSVGVPYQDFYPLLSQFKTVYSRNIADRDIAKRVHYCPDLTFLLPNVFGPLREKPEKANQLGIILTRTYYNSDFTHLYHDFVEQMAHFIELVPDFDVCLIPFGINPNNSQENDLLIHADLLAALERRQKCTKFPTIFRVQKIQDYVKETYFQIARMSFNV
jgi:hypothetical protein